MRPWSSNPTGWPGGGDLDQLAGAGAAVVLAGAALEILDVAEELHNVLEAGERALVAVVASPA